MTRRIENLSAAIREVRPGYSEAQARAVAERLDGEEAAARIAAGARYEADPVPARVMASFGPRFEKAAT